MDKDKLGCDHTEIRTRRERTSGQVKHAKPHILYIKLQTIYILAGFKLLQLKTCRFGLLSRNVQIVYDTKVELNVMEKNVIKTN